MSLIIDALKKAQQLKMKEGKGPSPPQHPTPGSKKRPGNSIARWVVIGAALASLVFFVLVLWWPASPPRARSDQASVPKKEKTALIAEGTRGGLPRGTLDAPEGLPKEGLAPSRKTPILSEIPAREIITSQKEIVSPPKEPPEETKEETLSLAKGSTRESVSIQKKEKIKEPLGTEVEEKKALRAGPEKQAAEKRGPTIKTPPAQIEEVTTKREVEKGPVRTSEALDHFNSGVSSYNKREIAKAIDAYRRVIDLDPTYIEAYNNLGLIYQELGDFPRAFEAYRRSIEINPQYEKAYNNLGILLHQKGRDEEAVEVFQKALLINPNNVETHINLGILLKRQGQLDKGIESYEKALAINPFQGETHYNIALLYEQLGKVDLAIDHYRKFIHLSSSAYPDLASKVQTHLNLLSTDRMNKQK